MNRTFAFAKVYGHDKAIPEAEKLKLTDSNYFHELLSYLYADTNIDKAICHYEQAVGLTKSKPKRQTLTKKIKRLQGENGRQQSAFVLIFNKNY